MIKANGISLSLMYKLNCIVAAITPLLCLLMAVVFNGANPLFMSISGYYILMPSRLIFPLLIASCVGVHLWFLSKLTYHRSTASLYWLEIVVFISVCLIALAPANDYPIHGVIGGVCFSSAFAFMAVHYRRRDDKNIFDFVTIALAGICILGMPISFPWVLNWEIMKLVIQHANPDLIASMLNNHSGWQQFAVFEWTFFYLFLSYIYRLYHRFN